MELHDVLTPLQPDLRFALVPRCTCGRKVKKITVSLLLLLRLSAPALAATSEPASTVDEHVSVNRLIDKPIDAYLKRPALAAKVPLIILMQGSGCDSLVDPFLKLTEGLGGQFARLVVEKIGVQRGDDGRHCSADYLRYNTVDLRVTDYLQVLARLRATADWWNGDLYIIGASEGGLTAGIVAAFAPETRRVAILSYGGGVTMGEARPGAIYAEEIRSGKTPAQAEGAKAAAVRKYDEMRANPRSDEVFDGETNTHKWWASIIDLRLANLLPDVKVPIYLAQGENDQEMPIASSRQMADILKNKGRGNFVYCEYSGLSHEFKTEDGKSRLVGVFLDAIDWLTRTSSTVQRVPAECKGPLAGEL